MKVTKRLKILGKVQGVFYRESMRQKAKALGVTGWVRNHRDLSVEALVQGEATLVADLVAWCRRGPPSARVDSVEEKIVDEETALRDFIRRESL